MSFETDFNRVFAEQDQMNEDKKVAAYVVLCAAEHGCPQHYIKMAAGMMGVDWPPPGKTDSSPEWDGRIW